MTVVAPGNHRWIGSPLSAIAEDELREILLVLHDVAWGERGDVASMTRIELQREIARLDTSLDVFRRERECARLMQISLRPVPLLLGERR